MLSSELQKWGFWRYPEFRGGERDDLAKSMMNTESEVPIAESVNTNSVAPVSAEPMDVDEDGRANGRDVAEDTESVPQERQDMDVDENGSS